MTNVGFEHLDKRERPGPQWPPRRPRASSRQATVLGETAPVAAIFHQPEGSGCSSGASPAMPREQAAIGGRLPTLAHPTSIYSDLTSHHGAPSGGQRASRLAARRHSDTRSPGRGVSVRRGPMRAVRGLGHQAIVIVAGAQQRLGPTRAGVCSTTFDPVGAEILHPGVERLRIVREERQRTMPRGRESGRTIREGICLTARDGGRTEKGGRGGQGRPGRRGSERGSDKRDTWANPATALRPREICALHVCPLCVVWPARPHPAVLAVVGAGGPLRCLVAEGR